MDQGKGRSGNGEGDICETELGIEKWPEWGEGRVKDLGSRI